MNKSRPKKLLNTGLKPLPPDVRDFAMGGVFGTFPPPDVDFIVARPIKIKDQGENDKCTAYAGTAVSEDEECIDLDPDWQFDRIVEIMGGSSWGADLRSACKSFVQFGSKEVGNDNDPAVHKKSSFFSISSLGYTDLFDAIRASLYHYKDNKYSVLTGLTWQNEWINAQGGIINAFGTPAFGHAFKFCGQKKISGDWYLVAQLSQGVGVGDGGMFYFSRDVVNKGCSFGNFMFVDMSKEDAKYYHSNNIQVGENWLVQFYKIILNYLK